ncbi:AEC family transporter [Chthonobacter rhizosphaerae]|uniref:AEC family transporter n=1 Tax=Chthonobacter rhizosphaerae TaxID=2735553 RepID=UPI0015EE6B92|nr:AEC family transporter [Chthonobacter rhizosphaerae]
MTDIAFDVLPIFVLIAIGWAAVAGGLLKAEVGDALSDFVFKIAVPVLLFRTVARADFHGASPWGLWLAYFFGVVVTWTAGHLAATRLFKRETRLGVVAGVSSAFANNVFIGLPLIDRVLDAEGVVALSILLCVHLPVMMIAGTLMMERADRKVAGKPGRGLGAILTQVGRNLARNPLVIGLVAGSLARVLGVPTGGMPGVIIDQIAQIAGPAALLAMGMAVRKYGFSGHGAPAVTLAALKLFLMPACVFVAAHLLDLPPTWTAAIVLTSAVPTGVNAYLIASHFGVGHGLASSVITLTTALGALSVTAWALLLGV